MASFPSSLSTTAKTSLLFLLTSLAWTACSSDEVAPDGSGGSGADAGGGGGEGGDANDSSVAFTVPSGGGKVAVKMASGNTLEFEFPPSAAGKAVKLTPGDAADLGWGVSKLSEVVHMEPDGLEFVDPVILKNSKKNPLAFSHATKASKSKGEPLELSDDKLAHKVHHFSSIAYLNPDESCGTTNGWVEDTILAGEYCVNAGTASHYLYFNCATSETCYMISNTCCVEAGVTSCSLGDQELTLSYFEPYQPPFEPYCEVAGTGGQGTGGAASAGGAASTGGFGGAI